jgi:hypothetical protein
MISVTLLKLSFVVGKIGTRGEEGRALKKLWALSYQIHDCRPADLQT